MTAVRNTSTNRIPPEFFERARRLAAQERAKAIVALFAALERKLHTLLAHKQRPADVHYRFHRGGLWRGI